MCKHTHTQERMHDPGRRDLEGEILARSVKNYSMFVLETFLFCFAENVCVLEYIIYIFRIETKQLLFRKERVRAGKNGEKGELVR